MSDLALQQETTVLLGSGSQPLRKPAHERYARARSLLRPKLEAYRYAHQYDDQGELDAKARHAMRGNASKLERNSAVQARIAYLCRQEEEILAEKRKRLEEFLWLIHEANPADLWETAEKPKTDADGDEVVDEDGTPVMVRYQRLRLMADLPEDLQRTVESIKYTESGRPQVVQYSKMQANLELRKLLGIGINSDDRGGSEFERMSDEQLFHELARLANELQVPVTLGIGVGA